MQSKICTKCGQSKELNNYGVSSRGLYGRRSICRSCVSSYNREYSKNRWLNDEEYRLRKMEMSLKWAKGNPAKRSEIAKRRNKKEKTNHPEKVKARALVNQRVRFGRMPKASVLVCVECGEQANHYHHHLGYEFKHRYDVVPVCTQCHKHLG